MFLWSCVPTVSGLALRQWSDKYVRTDARFGYTRLCHAAQCYFLRWSVWNIYSASTILEIIVTILQCQLPDFQMLFLVPAVIYGPSCPAYLDSAPYCCHLGDLRTYQGPSCKYFSVYSTFQQRFPLNMYNLKGYAWPGKNVYNWHVKKTCSSINF